MSELESTTKNTISDVRRFLTEGQKPMEQGEFVIFWKSLTQEEKAEFMNADLQSS